MKSTAYYLLFALVASLGFGAKLNAAVYQNIHVLQKKQVVKDQRLELSPSFGFTINDKFKKHIFYGADLTYHINDNLGAQFIFAKAFGSNTTENEEMNQIASLNAVIPDVYMDWITSVGLTLTPFYGKAVLHDNLLFYYDIYLESALSLVKADLNVYKNSTVSPHYLQGGMFGVGFKIFLEDWFAIKIAIRDYIFADGNYFLPKKGAKKQFDSDPTTGIFDNKFLYYGFCFFL